MNVFVLKKMLMDTAEADYGWIYLFIPLHIYIHIYIYTRTIYSLSSGFIWRRIWFKNRGSQRASETFKPFLVMNQSVVIVVGRKKLSQASLFLWLLAQDLPCSSKGACVYVNIYMCMQIICLSYHIYI